jgi:hypothetical protein
LSSRLLLFCSEILGMLIARARSEMGSRAGSNSAVWSLSGRRGPNGYTEVIE